jgi:predicted transcriptional regulator
MQKMITTSFRLYPDLYRALAEYAVKTEMKPSVIIRQAIQQYLAKYSK